MQIHIILIILAILCASAYNNLLIMIPLAKFIKQKRKEARLTQEEFALRAGVALTVIRKIEQGKENVKLEKVNLVLKMFGHLLVPVSTKELSLKKEKPKT